MNRSHKAGPTRRSMFRTAAAAAMYGPSFQATQGTVSAQQTVNRNSAPSTLKITDMRACRVAANYDYPIIKIYTNQDVYGLGDVRDAGVEGIAMPPAPLVHRIGDHVVDVDPGGLVLHPPVTDLVDVHAITVIPRMYGCSAVGTVIAPSALR